MADTKVISELTELVTVDKATDWVPVVDVSDTTESVEGTTKKAVVNQFIGPKGDAATVDAGTTTTGDPGTNASVVNSGTTSAAVFDFTIPRGATGATGSQGIQGIQGIQGEKGDKGDTGSTGATGATGAKGDKGDKGDTGTAATADAGTTTTLAAGQSATVVNSGTTSAAVFDFGIPQGVKGDKGDQGDPGTNGTNGTDGLDINWLGAYDNSTNYVINDAISYGGSSYICKLASTGNIPTDTTYWDLMAQKGTDGTGAGDVIGPASSTDNAITRFDDGTGKILLDSLATLDDSGSINIPSGQSYKINGTGIAQNDLSDTTISSPTLDNVLKYNGSEWVNAPFGSVSTGAGINAYLDDTITVDNYGGLLTSPDTTTAEETDSATFTGAAGTKFIEGYLFNLPQNRTKWDGGVWKFNMYCKVNDADKVSEIIPAVYMVQDYGGYGGTIAITGTGTSRTATVTGATPFVSGDANADIILASYIQTAGGTFQITGYTSNTTVTIATDSGYANESGVVYSLHRYKFQVTTGEINATSATLYSVTTVQPDYTLPTLNSTAALRVYAKTTSTKNPVTISFTHNGSTHYSYIETPFTEQHNQLGGLQGGTASERYHLTSAQHSNLVTNASTSTDNAIARFDSTTGKIVQNSLVTIDDSGSINIPAGQQYLVNGSPDAGKYTWKGAWATSTVYVANDAVQQNGSGYICVTGHTSGTFATDLAAGKWSLFVEGVGGNSIQIDCSGGTSDTYGTLAGLINSSNTLYTVSLASYISGSLRVYLNGQLQTQGSSEDWVETTPTSGTFTFATAPATGDIIIAMYQFSSGATGNADTLDGVHASSFVLESEVAWQDWTPTFANFTKGSATITARYCQTGKMVYYYLGVTLAADSSMGTAMTFTLPVTSATYPTLATIQPIGQGSVRDAGTAVFTAQATWASTTTALVQVYGAASTYVGPTSLTSSVPMTWTTNDQFFVQGFYEAA